MRHGQQQADLLGLTRQEVQEVLEPQAEIPQLVAVAVAVREVHYRLTMVGMAATMAAAAAAGTMVPLRVQPLIQVPVEMAPQDMGW
jgi:hypothetical protein